MHVTATKEQAVDTKLTTARQREEKKNHSPKSVLVSCATAA